MANPLSHRARNKKYRYLDRDHPPTYIGNPAYLPRDKRRYETLEKWSHLYINRNYLFAECLRDLVGISLRYCGDCRLRTRMEDRRKRRIPDHMTPPAFCSIRIHRDGNLLILCHHKVRV